MIAQIKFPQPRLRFASYILFVFLFLSFGRACFPKSEPEFGILRVWLANSAQTNHTAGPNDVIYVEVKSFSGWVIRQVEVRGILLTKPLIPVRMT